MAEALGILGGTFDPVHLGHLRLAEEAREALGLARILWIPAGVPPHRRAPVASAAQRLEMVRRAVADQPAFAVDDAEVRSTAPSYTVATLERLRRAQPARPLVLLTGFDAFLGLEQWHRWQDLFDLAHIAFGERPGFEREGGQWPNRLRELFEQRFTADPADLQAAAAGCITRFPMTQLAISASGLRARIAAGHSARYLLPETVRAYIEENQLYRETDGP